MGGGGITSVNDFRILCERLEFSDVTGLGQLADGNQEDAKKESEYGSLPILANLFNHIIQLIFYELRGAARAVAHQVNAGREKANVNAIGKVGIRDSVHHYATGKVIDP